MQSERTSNSPDLLILIVTIALIMAGLVMVYSAELYTDQSYLGAQVKRIAIAVALGLFAYFVPLIDWVGKKHGWVVLIITFILLLLVQCFGTTRGGAARTWHGFQPSEFAKLGVAIFVAWYYARCNELCEDERGFWRYLFRPLLFCLPVLVLIVMQPAVSMAIVLTLTVFSLFLLAEVRWTQLALFILVGIVFFGAAIAVHKHTRDRVRVFARTLTHLTNVRGELMSPEPEHKTILWQQRQSWIAIGSGGLIGKGLGNGKQKFHFLPRVSTDFIFSLIGEEIGILGTVGIFALFLLFFLQGVFLVSRADGTYDRLLSFGIVLMITYTALIHLGVALRLIPPTGQPLPFVSYGGQALAANALGVGLLLRMSRRRMRRPIEEDFLGCIRDWRSHIPGVGTGR